MRTVWLPIPSEEGMEVRHKTLLLQASVPIEWMELETFLLNYGNYFHTFTFAALSRLSTVPPPSLLFAPSSLPLLKGMGCASLAESGTSQLEYNYLTEIANNPKYGRVEKRGEERHAVCRVPCAVCYVLYAVCCMLYAVYYILYAVCCVLCAV